MKRTLLFLVSLSLVCVLCVAAQAVGLSGKYYRYHVVAGTRKVVKIEWVDFQANGRCAIRSCDESGKRFSTEIAAFEIVGNYVQIAGDGGVVAYEIVGDRLESGDEGYLRASSVDKASKPKKIARKK